jgi:hypothetical protein
VTAIACHGPLKSVPPAVAGGTDSPGTEAYNFLFCGVLTVNSSTTVMRIL